jgi:hypothetical protein
LKGTASLARCSEPGTMIRRRSLKTILAVGERTEIGQIAEDKPPQWNWTGAMIRRVGRPQGERRFRESENR